MKIKKILLENVRSHETSDVNLLNGISIFTGRTGSGKSSILMAIEYALFGAEAGVPNNAIMRRGKQNCKVELEFEECGDEYAIVRSLKKQGSNITVDVNNMRILKNGKLLPLIGRSTDLNEQIIQILGYPSDIKPKELFEITSYTRQDEIRAIIELSTEKRQDYIDKILQLAKYKQTWENMKPILDFFDLELKEKKVRLESYDRLRKEIIDIEKKLIDLKSKIKENEIELSITQSKYESINQNVMAADKKYKEILEKRRAFDQLKGSEIRLKKDIEKMKEINATLLKQKNEINSQLSKIGHVPNIEELQSKNIEYIKTEEMLEKELSKTKLDFEHIKKLGKGKCPTCKQDVSERHIHDLEAEFSKIENKIKDDIGHIKKKQTELIPLLTSARQHKLLKENLERIESSISEKKLSTEHMENELNDISSKITEPSGVENLAEVENTLNAFKKQETGLVAKMQSISRENNVLASEFNGREMEFSEKGTELIELEKSKSDINAIEQTAQILSRMREDIRNIREIIRNNFLEDFKQEFQKKFEEIRKYEEEYSVDIKNDYEPVAFTSSGEEVPISNLSGGEKTSVALAYRLALANLAAQVSAIKPSEILVLDEPTTGFDQEDVKALPEALRNIRTIPQIIIVTHEEELKNAADYRFEVKKVSGKSTISSL